MKTIDEAKEAIDLEKRERVKRVGKALEELLQKENCGLDAVLTFRGGQWHAQVAIVPKE